MGYCRRICDVLKVWRGVFLVFAPFIKLGGSFTSYLGHFILQMSHCRRICVILKVGRAIARAQWAFCGVCLCNCYVVCFILVESSNADWLMK